MKYRNVVKNIIPIIFVVITPLKDNLDSCEKEVLDLRTSFQFYQEKDTLAQNKESYNIFDLYEKEDYAEFIKYALPYYNKIKDNKNLESFELEEKIGEAYKLIKKPKEALDYYKKSLNTLKSRLVLDSKYNQNKDTDLARVYNKIGALYQSLDKIDSAKFYHNEVENLPELNPKILEYKATTYNNLSGIYQLESEFDKAELYALKAIKIHKGQNNKMSHAISLNNLANIYANDKEFNKAKTVYFDALDIIRNEESLEAINVKADLYFNLAWSMRELKDYKAYDNLEKSIEFSDTIRKAQNIRMLEEVGKRIAVQELEREKEEEENRRLRAQRIFAIIVAFTLFIISLLVYFLRGKSLKQKNLELQLQQTELLKNKELDKLKSETQRRILNATIDGKETERKQIAETLHDSVSTLLSSANLHLQATKKRFNGNTPLEILKSQEIIQEATYKIRDLSHNLISSVLLKFGLDFALKDLSEKYSNTEMSILVKTNELRRYNQNFEIKVYNIIQEFINNAIKHSKASNTLIKLSEKNNTLYLLVADDGIGFDKSKIDTKKGLGLNQIDARIQIMDGEFTIKSFAGNGTEIFVKIPIIEKDITNFV